MGPLLAAGAAALAASAATGLIMRNGVVVESSFYVPWHRKESTPREDVIGVINEGLKSLSADEMPSENFLDIIRWEIDFADPDDDIFAGSEAKESFYDGCLKFLQTKPLVKEGKMDFLEDILVAWANGDEMPKEVKAPEGAFKDVGKKIAASTKKPQPTKTKPELVKD